MAYSPFSISIGRDRLISARSSSEGYELIEGVGSKSSLQASGLNREKKLGGKEKLRIEPE